eukprot:m.124636 g.124636  ORF g.124636 m.124636 type:complete len:129 (-) comp16626_c0_seq2:351-737(-)
MTAMPLRSVHSPYKQPVGQRLARGGLSVAYGMHDVAAVAPVAVSAAIQGTSVVVQLGGVGPGGLTVHQGAQGIEVLGGDNGEESRGATVGVTRQGRIQGWVVHVRVVPVGAKVNKLACSCEVSVCLDF